MTPRVLVVTLLLAGCAECPELGEKGCERARDCRPWYVYDATEEEAGQLCCGVDYRSEDEGVFAACLPESSAPPPTLWWSRDPATGRCYTGQALIPDDFERAELGECAAP